MKALAVLLALAAPLRASAQPLLDLPERSSAAAGGGEGVAVLEVSTLTVTAPRYRDEFETRVLKTARAAGAGVGLTGAGLMAYVLVLGLTGPFGWAASLIFLGGMTSYLSDRRLRGHDDFTASPSTAAVAGFEGAHAPVRAP